MLRFRLWLCLLPWLIALPAPAPAQSLAISFFGVGQGDAALLVSPAGKRVLIDGGPPEGAAALLEGLSRRRVDSIDLVILTHPHLDHLGGLARVVRALPVRMFLDSGFPHPSPAYAALMKALAERGVPVKQAAVGRKIDLGGGALLTLYGPPSPYLTGTRSDVNANSVVSRLAYRQASALFTGDAEPETERWLLGQGGDLSAGLLKVAHHGGRYSSTAEFLRAVRPEIAVISVGPHNDYGHPTPEAMARLQAAGARLYRTDRDGTVTARCLDGRHWIVETEGAPPPAVAPIPVVSAPVKAQGYVASRRSGVFHRAECPAARQISPGNLIAFPTREAALSSGRRPAVDCHP